MGIGDAITVVSCLAGLMFALPGLLIFLNLALIDTSSRAAERLSRGGILPFLVGLIPVVIIGIPAAILISLGSVFQFCGSIVMLALLVWGFLGLAVVARLVGMRISLMDDRDRSPLIQASTGAFVLAFGIAFPLIGWLVVFPFSLVIGMGAVLMVTVGRLSRLPGSAPQTVVQPREPGHYYEPAET